MEFHGSIWIWKALAAGVSVLLMIGLVDADTGRVNSAKVVKISATSSLPDSAGRQSITLTLEIEKGWYIYANPVEHDEIKGNQTVVKLIAPEKLQETVIQYPPGKLIKDKGFGDYRIFEDSITIRISLQRPLDDNGPVKLSVRFRADRNGGPCLLPANVVISVP